jgi:hypothetical protein
MPIPPMIAGLPRDKQSTLLTVAKPKFDAYLSITSNLQRSVWHPQGFFIYPDQTMIADVVYLWAVFSDVYEILGKSDGLSTIVRGEAGLRGDIQRIIEDGSYWHSPTGRASLERVPPHEAVDTQLKHVLRTLRNGFAHSNWLYEDLSALEYWKKRGWQTANALPAFDLQNRPRKNYMTYIADAKRWDPQNFWGLDDLRILVTPSPILRYHLHLFLNHVLNGSRKDVFGNEPGSYG